MIPVARVAAPVGYRKVKQRGDAWLSKHTRARRPKDLWSPFLPQLAGGFAHLCGYAAMLDPTGGTVDHYLSWRTRPDLAYEWSNFRFVSYILNSSKQTADDTVLDPYLVQRGWFEIILPSLQLCVTDKVPAAHRAKAEYTLKRLKLGDGEKIVRWRQLYYEQYKAGRLELEGLREIAPLVAEAVEREQRAGREPAHTAPKRTKAEPNAKKTTKTTKTKTPKTPKAKR